MKSMQTVFQEEQQRVKYIVVYINKQIEASEEETSQRRQDVVKSRKHFWEGVKVNLDSFDDFLETIIDLRIEAQALSISQSTHKHAAKKLSTLQKMENAPYFGRIDFHEQDMAMPEKIYIGISSLMDEAGEDFLIYDWRAPIASIYYEDEPGPAQYTTPGGIISGTLEKKWQYLIQHGELQSMFDTSLTIGDEILQQVLGKSTDKHMHSIVATIQSDQNKIIRHDKGRMLIVHGAAGSGKTSVAMQRIAYLLYKYRDYMKADQIILFSPNAMFNSYVSNVLPELGEENMEQVTFQEYLDHRLSDEFDVENPFDQLEYVLTKNTHADYETRVASIRYKATTAFYEQIQAYHASLEQSGMLFKDIIFRNKVIVTAEQLKAQFYNRDVAANFYSRLEKLKDWLLQQVKGVAKSEWQRTWVQDEMELLSDAAYYEYQQYLAKKRGFAREDLDDYEVEPDELAKLIVRQKLKPIIKKIKELQFIDYQGIYEQLFVVHSDTEWPSEWQHICRMTVDMLAQNKLYYEDATPFLLLQELIQGFHSNSAIKHIVVDEGQDYSPIQFEFLKRLFPAARMTILGDFNQAIFAHASDTVDFTQLEALYGADESAVINMARSYRSTKPIIDFTKSLIPNGKHIIPFERAGQKPILTKLNNHDELHDAITTQVASLQAKGYASIAIICKSAAESKQAHDALAHIEGIKLLKSTSFEYEQGVVVVPTYLSKGIEFDAVIIYDASKRVYGEESLRRVFYTACTRAMHELWVYSVGEESLLLGEAVTEKLIEMK